MKVNMIYGLLGSKSSHDMCIFKITLKSDARTDSLEKTIQCSTTGKVQLLEINSFLLPKKYWVSKSGSKVVIPLESIRNCNIVFVDQLLIKHCTL